MNVIKESEKAYIAGFLDGDGCINAQLVRRSGYRLLYQIRVSITFFQSSKRHWFLLQLHKRLGCGSVRKRNDGISEYCIVGIASVSAVCEQLLPYLRLKRRQAVLICTIIKSLSRHQSKEDFLSLCELADQISFLNNSKKRSNTACLVRKELDLLFPVETSDTKVGDTSSG
uniref:Putative site-specific DNA endonuclease n=1 Tax=Chlorokybus atmophyticus TaxID=3144 RepID=A6YE73_CHLAT|nr:putative site-specific DNA endonuclease [Chlorokybus atmophyticus]ABO15127.1 putative site-specific DNA endonuclease [Chlorokybus atmophyticus]